MNVISQILSVLPSIINGIEQLFGSMPGQGKIKKETALSGVKSIIEGAQKGGVKIEAGQILDAASKFIDGYVAVQNMVGGFERGDNR